MCAFMGAQGKLEGGNVFMRLGQGTGNPEARLALARVFTGKKQAVDLDEEVFGVAAPAVRGAVRGSGSSMSWAG
jgi:hypothetical protein